jgi:drug/metabolite transporter (DMT)-like permease
VKVAAAFVSLAALWGSSFLFLRLAVPDFGPILAAELRVGIAWIILSLLVGAGVFRRYIREKLQQTPAPSSSAPPLVWWQMAIVGLTNSALPFALYGFAALSLPAGYLAILNSLVPLWGALLASIFLGQSVRWTLVAGVLLAGLGISLLVRLGPVEVNTQTLLAGLACAGATLCYAIAGQLTRRWLSHLSAVHSARATLGYATLWILPFIASDVAAATPTPVAWGAVLALGIVSSALAYLLFFWLLKQIGPVRASSVTFLIPGFGVLWGALFLGEPLSLHVFAGLALVVVASLLVQRP